MTTREELAQLIAQAHYDAVVSLYEAIAGPEPTAYINTVAKLTEGRMPEPYRAAYLDGMRGVAFFLSHAVTAADIRTIAQPPTEQGPTDDRD